MTKKQLRQRLQDIAEGAGLSWDEENGFFEPVKDVHPTAVMYWLQALQRTFNLSNESLFLALYNIDEYETLDSATDFWWRNRNSIP